MIKLSLLVKRYARSGYSKNATKKLLSQRANKVKTPGYLYLNNVNELFIVVDTNEILDFETFYRENVPKAQSIDKDWVY